MHELRTRLAEEEFLALVREMRPQGYRLFVLRDAGEIVAVAGVAVQTNLYYLRHLWVYDLVTRADRRSEGFGRRLLESLEDLGRRDRCAMIALSSGVQRVDAHRFYEGKMGYGRASYCFTKSLRPGA